MAMCNVFPCVTKFSTHGSTLFQFTAPEQQLCVMKKFEQDYHLLSGTKHSHIVQFLGTYRDPESRLLMLLMEPVNGQELDMIPDNRESFLVMHAGS